MVLAIFDCDKKTVKFSSSLSLELMIRFIDITIYYDLSV